MTKSSPNSNPEPRQALPKNIVIWLVAAAAGLLVIILLIVAVSRPAQPSSVSLGPASAAVPGLVLDNADAERRALAKAQLQRLQHEGVEIIRVLNECEQELVAWDREVQSELTGKRGQAVAADTESLERFAAVYGQPRTSKSELDGCRSRVDALLEPVMAALSSGSFYTPAGDTANQLASERQFAEIRRQTLRQTRQDALSVFAYAERKGATGTRSLQEALAELESNEAQIRVTAITAAQEKAHRETTQRIAHARAEQELAHGQGEETRIKEETRRDLEKQRADDSIKAQQMTHATLKARAENPAIQAKYQPFLAKGRVILDTSPVRYYDMPGPVSLATLQRKGALSDAKTFAYIGCGKDYPWSKNDRPKWDCPPTEEALSEYAGKMEEFRQLSPHWIDSGVLKP